MGLIGCDKEPTPSFYTDKIEYIAGDTVKLTNTSLNDNSFMWTMPNGRTSSSSNSTFVIDSTLGFTSLNIKLDAFDNDGDNNFVSKTISVIPASVFSIDSVVEYRPLDVKFGELVANNFPIGATNVAGIYNGHKISLTIYLPGPSAPTVAGTYGLQYNVSSQLPAGVAGIYLEDAYGFDLEGIPSGWDAYTSLSGQLQLTIENGKVHAVFNHIQAQHTSSSFVTYPNRKISGDIYSH